MINPDFFQTVPDLAGLSVSQIDTLVSYLEVETCESGHVFIEEDQPGDDAFFLLEGEVSVTRLKGADARVKELNRMAPREIFGIISLIDNKERTSTCRALCETKVARLSREAFNSLRDKSPAIGFHLQCIIAQQISRDHKFFSNEIKNVIFSGNVVDALKSKDGLVITDTYKGPDRRSDIFTGYNGPERRDA